MKKQITLVWIFIFLLNSMLQAQGIYDFYGATLAGGQDNLGTIFSTRFDGTGHQVKKFFEVTNPGSADNNNKPVALNGKFYMILSGGGLLDAGIIAEYDPGTGKYKKLRDLFTYGQKGTSAGMVAYNNKLYGTTLTLAEELPGVIFEFDPAANALSIVHHFVPLMGRGCAGDLTLFNNKLYGITMEGGTEDDGVIFEYDPATGIYTRKRNLFRETTGKNARAGFTLYNNKLWAVTTESSGPLKGGFLLSYDPATNNLEAKAELGSISAEGHQGALAVVKNKLYGYAKDKLVIHGSVIFEYDPSQDLLKRSKIVNEVADFNRTTMLSYNNILYGTTEFGGGSAKGILFSYDPVSKTYGEKVLFNSELGGQPQGAMMLNNNKMYGLTNRNGSTPSSGAMFEYNPVSDVYTKKIDLGGDLLINPNGKMALYKNKLFGVAASGGPGSNGGFFSYNFYTQTYSELYQMKATDGLMERQGGLTLFNNKFYGVAMRGGTNDVGQIFEFDPTGNVYKKLYDFSEANGKYPSGLLIEYSGKLYGTCESGGTNNRGTLFEFDPATNQLTTKVLFDGTRGSTPKGGLTLYNGKMYGVTRNGGTNNLGTMFEYYPLANGLVKLADFSSKGMGILPEGGLALYDKKLYGLTSLGDDFGPDGKLYEYDLTKQTLTKKIDLDKNTGNNGLSRLTLAGNKFLGMTNKGGDVAGVLFEYDPVINDYVSRTDFIAKNGLNPDNNELVKVPVLVAPGEAGNCRNANTEVINAANANEWIAFTDKEGRAVAEINANGNILGGVRVSFFINGGAIREQGGTYYADRNVTITTEFNPVTPVSVRLYLQNSEFLTLRNTANSGVILPQDISLFKNNDVCAQNIGANTVKMPTTYIEWGLDHVYSTEVSSFSSFYFASKSKLLPIQILSITGIAKGSNNLLSWKATCTGSSTFEIERSMDAINFATIGSKTAVPADCKFPFNFEDVNPPAKSFYRLKMTNENSTVKYSEVVQINRTSGEELAMNIFPNPVTTSQAQLRIISEKEQSGTIRITDAAGRLIKEEKLSIKTGTNNITVNMQEISAGIYYLKYTNNDGENKTLKLVKQ